MGTTWQTADLLRTSGQENFAAPAAGDYWFVSPFAGPAATVTVTVYGPGQGSDAIRYWALYGRNGSDDPVLISTGASDATFSNNASNYLSYDTYYLKVTALAQETDFVSLVPSNSVGP